MKLIAFLLVMAVSLVGAGYAAWGNAIVNNTTLNTGHWEVVLENDVTNHSLVATDSVGYFKKTNNEQVNQIGDLAGHPLYGTKDSTHISGGAPGANDDYVYTIEPNIESDLKTCNFEFFNMHPGTNAITSYEIRNKGSIPAKIKNITVLFNGKTLSDFMAEHGDTSNSRKLLNAIKVNGNISKHYSSNNPTSPAKILPTDTTLANLEANLETLLVNDDYTLNPKTSKDPSVLDSDEMEVNNLTFSIPIDGLNGYEGMDRSLKVSITYDFVQYNVMVQQ